VKKFKGMRESLKGSKEVSNSVAQEESDTHKTKDGSTSKKGLWYNINQKKKRGEAPAKKGDPDRPSNQDFVDARKTTKESTELDEAIDFRKAFMDIQSYAKKSGGIDKTDFEKVAYYVKAIGDNQNTPNVANKAFMAMKKHIAGLDTDVRDGIHVLLKKHGMVKNGRMVQESTDVSENLNPKQIALLKKNYSTIDRIDPSGPAYKKAKGMISGLEKDNLIDLAKAKVKFLSQIAADELRKQHNVKLKASEYMESVKESTINELTTVDREKLVKVFDKLKKGSTVKIKSNDSIKKGDDYIEFVVKSKSTVRKGEVEKITLANKGNPTGVKRFLYKRVGTSMVSFAVGDMAASIVDIKESTKMDEAIGKLPPNASREDKIKHTMKIMKMYPANKGKSEKELRKGATDYIDQFTNKNKKTDAYIAKMKSKEPALKSSDYAKGTYQSAQAFKDKFAKKKKESVDEAKTNWKMGDGRPRNGARIENERFWNLPYDSLKYIAKDAGDAMKANPTARKATTGPGNWADQVADAATVMQWRKKNGIKESDEGVEEASIIKTTHKNVTNKKSVEKDRKKAVKTLADIRKGKYAGVKMANEDHDSSCVTESMELGELTTQQLIKKLGADTIFKKKYSAAADKVKEIMFKHGDKPRHGKEYYAGKIARQVDLDPHILALMVD
jgi:hypothetical protein